MQTFLLLMLLTNAVLVHASDNVADIFHTLENGTPRVTSLEQSSDQVGQVLAADHELLSSLEFRAKRKPQCDRYFSTLSRLLGDIQTTIQTASIDPLLRETRLRLLIPATFAMYAMFEQGNEGNFRTFAGLEGERCPLNDRAFTTRAFAKLKVAISELSLKVLGNPGILGLDQIQDELLRLADRQAIHQNRVEKGFLVASIATSILFWEFAPAVVLRFAGPLLAGRNLIYPGFVVNGARMAAIVGENLGFLYLDNRLFPDRSARIPAADDNWSEQLTAINSILESPVASPELYSVYMAQIQLQLSELYQPWIHAHLDKIKSSFDQPARVQP